MNFTDIDEHLTSEDLEGASENYFEPEGRKPLEPGRYLSRSRTLEQGTTQKGKPCIKVNFHKDTFTKVKGDPIIGFPPFETLYFHKNKAWNGEGEISAVSKYLKACKLKFQDWAKGELAQLLPESASVPVVVIVGWEQDYKEVQARQQMDPEYKAKKSAFFKKADGSYTHQKQDETGQVCTARAKVVGYEVYNG